jgi:hypothetical protein
MSTSIGAFASAIGDRATYNNTDVLGTVTTQPISLNSKYQMNYGASSSDSNNTTTLPTKYYEGQHSITIASSTYDIDLTQLTDVFGNVLNFSKIYKIVVVNNDLTGGSGLILRSNPTNGWTALFNGSTTGQQLIQAGGRYTNESPYGGFNVTAGSKVLRIQNDAASPSGNASFNLHLWGS